MFTRNWQEALALCSLAALKQSQHVLGSLADKIRVPDQFVTAIETALGHHLRLVLTEEPEAARQILADLSAKKRGRASIAPLEFTRNGHSHPGQESVGTEPAAEAGDSAIGPVELNGVPLAAIKVVDGDPSVRPLLQRLLGLTRIVRNLEAATTAWNESSGAFSYVTLEGELLSRHGVYTGGSNNGNGNGKAASSILGRKNQIAELQRALDQLQAQVAEVSRRKGTSSRLIWPYNV